MCLTSLINGNKNCELEVSRKCQTATKRLIELSQERRLTKSVRIQNLETLTLWKKTEKTCTQNVALEAHVKSSIDSRPSKRLYSKRTQISDKIACRKNGVLEKVMVVNNGEGQRSSGTFLMH